MLVRPSTELLYEAGYISLPALFNYTFGPMKLHRSAPWPRFSTHDYPFNSGIYWRPKLVGVMPILRAGAIVAAGMRCTQVYRTQEWLAAQEAHARRGTYQVGNALVCPLLILDADSQPDMMQSIDQMRADIRDQVCHALCPLGEYLEDMIRAARHDLENIEYPFVGHGLQEQVSHRTDEDRAFPSPMQRLLQNLMVKPWLVIAFDVARPAAPYIDPLSISQLAEGVAEPNGSDLAPCSLMRNALPCW